VHVSIHSLNSSHRLRLPLIMTLSDLEISRSGHAVSNKSDPVSDDPGHDLQQLWAGWMNEWIMSSARHCLLYFSVEPQTGLTVVCQTSQIMR